MEKEINFQKLTPYDKVELGIYEQAFDFIFQNEDIRNIAVSGSYGSGKSSVISSYKNKKGDKKFLHISVAHFSEFSSKIENDEKEILLEGKILNQLIHQIDFKNIPETNFKIKQKYNEKKIQCSSLKVILFLLAFFHLFFLKKLNKYIEYLHINNNLLSIISNPFSILISVIVILCGLYTLIYKIMIFQKSKNILHKINIQGNEIEISREEKDSYFDKYLDEVLYILENSGVDAIIFEDIDRFKNNKIFEKLREINILLNLKLKKENKIIRFIYLLKDDIFFSKERTKFFDYIIPIIPVIDSSNSYNKLIELLDNLKVYFEDNFLRNLSLYIDDMRVLKNIYNEFLIYLDNLNSKNIELDYNKVFAIITYKNIFPKDFHDLQFRKGFIFSFFENFIKNEKMRIQKELENIEKETLKSLEELNCIFNPRRNSSFYLSEKDEKEYQNRKKAIENRQNKVNLEKELLNFETKTVKEFINEENVESIFNFLYKNEIGEEINFDEVKKNEYFGLIKYLIIEGYIDENYTDYITYFYENNLTIKDKIFIRSIKERKRKDYHYKLENPKLIISYLKEADFKKSEILNFNLLNELLSELLYENIELFIEKNPVDINPIEEEFPTKSVTSKFIEAFVRLLKEQHNINFINLYYENEKNLNREYIVVFNKIWPDLLEYWIENKKAYSEKYIKYHSIKTFCFCNENTIESINKNNILSQWISANPDYLNINNLNISDIPNIAKGLKILGIKFKKFIFESINFELFKNVYNLSLYEINFENLELILEKIHKFPIEEIRYKNYSSILKLKDSPILEYIQKNINDYMKNLIENGYNKILDTEDAICKVLNNKIIDESYKLSYIKLLQDVTINEINKIEHPEFWDLLFEKKIVKYNEKNIIEYFSYYNEINEILINFINTEQCKLNFSKNTIKEVSLINLFFEKIIKTNEINDSIYEKIITQSKILSTFNFENVSEAKVSILIKNDIIEMNQENLLFIRKHYPNQNYTFICKNFDKYLETLDKFNYLFESKELEELLQLDIKDELKLKLLKFTREPISINKNYSSEIISHIIDFNFDNEDAKYLFSNFLDFNEDIKEKILKLVEKYEYQEILTTNLTICPLELRKKIIKKENIDKNLKLKIFYTLNLDTIRNYIKYLNLAEEEQYFKIFDKDSSAIFTINNINENILEFFKENQLIKNFYKNEENLYYNILI